MLVYAFYTITTLAAFRMAAADIPNYLASIVGDDISACSFSAVVRIYDPFSLVSDFRCHFVSC